MSETALDYLVGSTTRLDTLWALRDHGPLSVRALETRVTASRRTLKRTLRTMESRGWVRDADGQYELTSFGGTILSAYESFRDHERVANQFRPLLERMPDTAFDLNLHDLAEANVYTPDDDPTAAIDRLLELRTDARRIRQCTPFMLFDTVQQLVDRATTDPDPPDLTLVLNDTEPSSERFPPGYCEAFETMITAPSVDVYVFPEGVPFAFGTADDHAFVYTLDVDGLAHSLIESDAPGVVDWADRMVDEYLADADPV